MKASKENNGSVGLGEKLSQERLSSGKRKWTTRVVLLLIILLAAGGIYAYMSGANKSNKYEFATVRKMDLRETVEITGNLEAGATINLTFRASGQLEKVNYRLGDQLKAGDVIANLKNRDQELQLNQAKTNLQAAQANLNQRLAGSTNEEIAIAETAVKKTEAASERVSTDWNNAKDEIYLIKQKYLEDEKRLQLQLDDAQNKLDYALKNQGNTGQTSEQVVQTAQKDLQAQLYTAGSQLQQSLLDLKSVIIDDVKNNQNNGDFEQLDYLLRSGAKPIYNAINADYNDLLAEINATTDISIDDLKSYTRREQQYMGDLLSALKMTLDNMSSFQVSITSKPLFDAAITKLQADSSSLATGLSVLNAKYQALISAELGLGSSSDAQDSAVVSAQSQYDQQVQAVAQAKLDHRIDLNSREANIRDLQAQYQMALADIDSANANLRQVKAGPRAVDVAFLRTQIAASQIAVELAQESLEKTLLRAPIDGKLSRSNIEVGEDVVSSGAVAAADNIPVFEMISDQKFKISAEIAEVDINKLKAGDEAEITFDAIGDDLFHGTIAQIDPVQTTIQGVVFYKAEVIVDSTDPRIKPGMTATVDIVLKEVKGALTVPEKSIQSDNGRNYVRILENGLVKDIDVQTGIRNLQGDIEIKEGLSEGQEIIVKTNDK